MTLPDSGSAAASAPPPRRGWRTLAQLGFWFFLIKGLLWLLVPLALAWWAKPDAF